MLDREKSNILDESMLVVKTTLENISPEKAKTQLLLLWEDDKKPEILAMLSAMPVDKRKKIVEEFIGPEEDKKFKDIVTMLLDGGKTVELIDKEKAKVEQQRRWHDLVQSWLLSDPIDGIGATESDSTPKRLSNSGPHCQMCHGCFSALPVLFLASNFLPVNGMDRLRCPIWKSRSPEICLPRGFPENFRMSFLFRSASTANVS